MDTFSVNLAAMTTRPKLTYVIVLIWLVVTLALTAAGLGVEDQESRRGLLGTTVALQASATIIWALLAAFRY
jgi:hypothetical protein